MSKSGPKISYLTITRSDDGKSEAYHAVYVSGHVRKLKGVTEFNRLVENGYGVRVSEPVKIHRVDVRVVGGRKTYVAVMTDGSEKRITKSIFDQYQVPSRTSPSKSPSRASPSSSRSSPKPKRSALRSPGRAPSKRRVTWGVDTTVAIPGIPKKKVVRRRR